MSDFSASSAPGPATPADSGQGAGSEAAPARYAAAVDSSAAPPPLSQPRRWRWLRRLLVLAGLVLLLYLCRFPILRAAGGWLVAEDSAGLADVVLVMELRHCPLACSLCQEQAVREVLVIPGRRGRLERLGIMPPFEELVRRELVRRGLSGDCLTVRSHTGTTTWEQARCLSGWLCERPEVRVVVLCDRFGSRRLRCILDRVLTEAEAGRVNIRAVAHPWYDETTWWQCKEGMLGLFGGYLQLGYVWLGGDDSTERAEWDLEQFEKALKHSQ